MANLSFESSGSKVKYGKGTLREVSNLVKLLVGLVLLPIKIWCQTHPVTELELNQFFSKVLFCPDPFAIRQLAENLKTY